MTKLGQGVGVRAHYPNVYTRADMQHLIITGHRIKALIQVPFGLALLQQRWGIYVDNI